MIARAKLRNWGSSLGIVIPSKLIRSQNLREGDEVSVDIRPAMTLKALFGILKGREIDAQKMKDEIREEDKRRDEKLSRLIRTGGNR
ncbi:AbrB/MazE/SpoVT family DNA-binding domain-containing protein [Candidatus Woesearchaeota archaeon]|nr:AbrB/MazE/SpoVT family DNA-binding domain-containing protein [Candidatus Woesearchaeota archaeon]